MQIVELAAKLQSVGLTDKQAKIYVAALFLGPSSVQKIAQQASVNRATAYVILDELIEMGLVSQSSESGKTVFVAEAADAISRHLESLETDIQARKTELKKLSGELDKVARQSDVAAPQVFFFKGKEGINQVNSYYRKHAKKSSVLYSLTDNDEATRIVPDNVKTSPSHRIQNKIAVKALFSAVQHPLKTDPKLLRQVKELPQKAKAEILLQENFAIFSTYTDSSFVSMVVESPDIVAGLRQIFELAWDNYQPKKK